MHPFITGEKHTGPFIPNPPKRTDTGDSQQSRGPRPRANTISSSQIDKQNVPPQLQKLVALSSTTSGVDRNRKGDADELSDKEKEEYIQQQKALARGKSADSHHHRHKHEHPPAVIAGDDVSMDSPGGAAPPPQREEALAQAEEIMRTGNVDDDDTEMDTSEDGVSQGLQKMIDGLTVNNGAAADAGDDMDSEVTRDGPRTELDNESNPRRNGSNSQHFGDAVLIEELTSSDQAEFASEGLLWQVLSASPVLLRHSGRDSPLASPSPAVSESESLLDGAEIPGFVVQHASEGDDRQRDTDPFSWLVEG